MRKLLMLFLLLSAPLAFSAGVSGTIYVDGNLNSAIDSGESAPTGSTVFVNLVQLGVVMQSTTMNASTGAYAFAVVAPGTYSVIVAKTATATAAGAPTNYNFETPASGSATITVVAANITQNFALTPQISGTVFADVNANSTLDAGEVAPTGTFFVNLVQGGVVKKSTTAAASGAYSFTGVAAGTYTVIVTDTATDAVTVVPAGYDFESPAAGSASVTVGNSSVTGTNFALGLTMNGTVFADANLNGVLDAGENPPTGSVVYVNLIAAGVLKQSAQMNALTGNYTFTNVANGSYSVVVTTTNTAVTAAAPPGYSFETPASGSTAITVSSASVSGTKFALGAAISGTIYLDSNDNGLLDSGETAPTGSTIYVNAVQNGAVVSSSTMNAVSGAYSIPNVPNGTTTVVMTNSATSTTAVAPTNYSFRNPASGVQYLTMAGSPLTNENYGVVTTGTCICGYTDGQFVHYSGTGALTMDGSFADWATVLAKPDNNACDPTGTADKDAPIQSTGRDLVQFAYTWDDTYFYAYTRRQGSSSNTDKFIYYGDTSNDGKMQTGEPVIVVAWAGSNRTVSVYLGTYNAVNAGGDSLVGASGYGDGYSMPGTISGLPSTGNPNYTFVSGSPTGTEMEWRVKWSDLNVPAGNAIGWHVSSTNTTPGSGSFPGSVDDNMGGCGACAGSNQTAGVGLNAATTGNGSRSTTVYLPHVITNTGNGVDTFNLTSTSTGAWTPTAIRYYKDLGTVGQYDSGVDTLLTDTNGDGTVDTGKIARNGTMNILVAVDIPNGSGSATITTKATSIFVPACAQTYSPVSASVSDTVNIVGGIYGTVFSDVNHNTLKDVTETGTGLSLFCKLVLQGATSASQAATVNTSTGAYVLPGVAAGNYTIILSTNNTLTDIAAIDPSGWVGTLAPSGKRSVTMGSQDLLNQDFGLYNGSSITATVFQDNGAGQSAPTGANDGVKNGTEAGVGGVAVRLTDGSGTQLDSATSDGSGNFTLYAPAGTAAARIAKTDPSGWVNTGASFGTAPSAAYSRDTDLFSYTPATGSAYAGVQLGMVPGNDFSNNNALSGLPGTELSYRHTYTPGTSGTVTFTVARTPNPSAVPFGESLYRDVNCDMSSLTQIPVTVSGNQISGSVTATAGVKICLVVKEFIPGNAPINSTDALAVGASMTYTNAPAGQGSAPSSSLARNDETTVGQPSDSGLTLTKSVDLASAAPGASLTYTLTYANNGTQSLSNVIVYDSVPAYTTLLTAACPASGLPNNLSACTFTQSGSSLKWQFTGTLAPGASGSISYKVQINP